MLKLNSERLTLTNESKKYSEMSLVEEKEFGRLSNYHDHQFFFEKGVLRV